MFVIPLFLLKHFHYSIIPPKKAHIIPLFQEQNFRYSYSIIPLQPPTTMYVKTVDNSARTQISQISEGKMASLQFYAQEMGAKIGVGQEGHWESWGRE